jgi:hypothetical protein
MCCVRRVAGGLTCCVRRAAGGLMCYVWQVAGSRCCILHNKLCRKLAIANFKMQIEQLFADIEN